MKDAIACQLDVALCQLLPLWDFNVAKPPRTRPWGDDLAFFLSLRDIVS